MECTHTYTISCLPSKSSTETDDSQLFLELISLSPSLDEKLLVRERDREEERGSQRCLFPSISTVSVGRPSPSTHQPTPPSTWWIKQRTSFVGQVFSERLSPHLCIPIQYSPRKKSHAVVHVCMCLCLSRGLEGLFASPPSIDLSFSPIYFSSLPYTIHSDLPLGEELGVETLSGLVAAS